MAENVARYSLEPMVGHIFSWIMLKLWSGSGQSHVIVGDAGFSECHAFQRIVFLLVINFRMM